jgi:hypothetical protein
MPPQKQMVSKSKIKVMSILPSKNREYNVLNLSDEIKILCLLKGGISLAKVGRHYRKNEASIHRIQDKECEIRSSFW